MEPSMKSKTVISARAQTDVTGTGTA